MSLKVSQRFDMNVSRGQEAVHATHGLEHVPFWKYRPAGHWDKAEHPFTHTVFVVAVHGCDTTKPSGHVEQAEHSLSRIPSHFRDKNWPGPQVAGLHVEHCELLVALQAFEMY